MRRVLIHIVVASFSKAVLKNNTEKRNWMKMPQRFVWKSDLTRVDFFSDSTLARLSGAARRAVARLPAVGAVI